MSSMSNLWPTGHHAGQTSFRIEGGSCINLLVQQSSIRCPKRTAEPTFQSPFQSGDPLDCITIPPLFTAVAAKKQQSRRGHCSEVIAQLAVRQRGSAGAAARCPQPLQQYRVRLHAAPECTAEPVCLLQCTTISRSAEATESEGPV